MKTLSLALSAAIVFSTLAFTSPQEKPADSGTLESVLKTMDTAAANFHATQAEFERDSYEKVINEVDEIQTGTIYFRRVGKDIEMMAEVKMAGPDLKSQKPERKYVLYSGGKISIYEPKIEQVTAYDLGKNRVGLESYVVLGFGGSGSDLAKSFDVTYVGPETIDGVATAQLQLIPKSEKVRNNYNKILLWIDLKKGISLQQQFFSPQGDYRLTKYTSIQEKKIPDNIFKLNTTSKTKTISPKG
jgi:outer membrane lipoprotein-sorting protein